MCLLMPDDVLHGRVRTRWPHHGPNGAQPSVARRYRDRARHGGWAWGVMIALLTPIQAAACGPSQSINQLVNFGTLVVPETVPIGAVIASRASSPEFTTRNFYCEGNPVFRAELSSFTDAHDARKKIYRTDVPGVGIRIFKATGGAPDRRKVYPYELSRGSALFHDRETYYVELIKIGEITRGDLAGRKLASSRLRATESFRLYMGTAEIIGRVPTCDLHVSDQVLPPVRPAEFGADRVAGRKRFSISATCRNARSVDFAFSGVASPLDPQRFRNNGTATGVNLWLYSASDGVTIKADGTDNVRTVAVVNNAATLALGAAYWRSADAALPGSLISNVTVNISYR